MGDGHSPKLFPFEAVVQGDVDAAVVGAGPQDAGPQRRLGEGRQRVALGAVGAAGPAPRAKRRKGMGGGMRGLQCEDGGF